MNKIDSAGKRRLIFVAVVFLLFGLALYSLGSSGIVLMIAFAASYLSYPFIEWLEKKGIHRTLSIIVTMVFLLGITAAFFVAVIPPLFREIHAFILSLPDVLDKALEKIHNQASQWDIPFDWDYQTLSAYGKTHATELLNKMAAPGLQITQSLFTGGLAIVTVLLNIFIFPVFFFFVAYNHKKIMKSVDNLFAKEIQTHIRYYSSKLNEILSGYIRGQVLVCVCLSIVYGCGLFLVGIPFGWIIGLAAGLLSFIPYVGFSLGLATSLLFAMVDSSAWNTYLGIALVFATGQVLENFLIVPRFVGKRVGLNSLQTMLVLIAGANLFGFVGLMIAIPVGGFLKVVLKDALKAYRE